MALMIADVWFPPCGLGSSFWLFLFSEFIAYRFVVCFLLGLRAFVVRTRSPKP